MILKAVDEFLDTAHDTSEAIKEVISMELHHIKARHKGGSHAYENLRKVTPWEHDELDQYRHFVP